MASNSTTKAKMPMRCTSLVADTPIMHWIFLITIYLTKSRGLVRSSFTMLAAPIMDRTQLISLSEAEPVAGAGRLKSGEKQGSRGLHLRK